MTEVPVEYLAELAERVDTMYGRQDMLIRSHKDLREILNPPKPKAKLSEDGNVCDFVAETLSQNYYYPVEWGEYKTAFEFPAQIVVGDIIEMGNLYGFFGNVPVLAEVLGYGMNLFCGGKRMDELSSKIDWVYGREMDLKQRLDGIDKKYKKFGKEWKVMDELKKKKSNYETMGKGFSSLTGDNSLYDNSGISFSYGDKPNDKKDSSNKAGFSFEFNSESGTHKK